MYNIQVSIKLPDEYPEQAPNVHVVPTAEMEIMPSHAHVNEATGRVHLQYLQSWDLRDTPNLVGLLKDMCYEFGEKPPLVCKLGLTLVPAAKDTTAKDVAKDPIFQALTKKFSDALLSEAVQAVDTKMVPPPANPEDRIAGIKHATRFLRLSALDVSLERLLAFLDVEGLEQKTIPMDFYEKMIRHYSSEQFRTRLLIM